MAKDEEALARFEREALAVAALSHPNILAIFDFGSDGGIAYAVMELLEGETLRDMLREGPLPQRKAVDYAIQVARGLAAAHEKGIVHRDLKPENLFVTKEGHVKILDFGVAKRLEQTSSEEDTSAPTVSAAQEPGTVVGTVAYMSPEQVRGRPVDHRSDIFSFGVVLYEMLSGERAFKRDTSAETMTAILKEEPPELSGTDVPLAVDRIVRHCLEKVLSSGSVRPRTSRSRWRRRLRRPRAVAGDNAHRQGKHLIPALIATVVLMAALGVLSCGRNREPALPRVRGAWPFCRSRTSEPPRTTTSPTVWRMKCAAS